MQNQEPPKLEKSSWIAGIISAILAAAALAYTFWGPRKDNLEPVIEQNAGVVGNQFGAVAGDVTIIGSTTTPATEYQPRLSKVFEADIIGGDIKYLESVIGPPRSKYNYDGERRNYKVDGCDLTVGARSDDTIDSLSLVVSPICNFNWRGILPNNAYLPQPNSMRFGAVMNRTDDWSITADCLSGCGNAADPTIELRFGGSRADGWLLTVLGAIVAGPDNVAAASSLARKIAEEKGEQFVKMKAYKCNYDLNKAAKGTLENMRVNYITIRPEDLAKEANVGSNERCR